MSTDTKDKPAEFTGWRAVIWPINNNELKKFLPMAIMMGLVLFVYTLVRNMKDTLVLNAPGSGGEVLGYLKFTIVLPAAILFFLIYTKMANALSTEKLFYATLAPFVVFFAAYGFILYPNVSLFHMTGERIVELQNAWPASVKWFIPIFGNWSYTLFYTMAELWGSVVLSLLFWQFANQITRVKEAKRFYAMFGILGNLGALMSGVVGKWCTNPDFAYSTKLLMAIIAFAGLAIMFIYSWMTKNVLTDPRYYDVEEKASGAPKKKKPKLSVGESVKVIFTSPYLGLIAALIIAYGVSINLVEAVWKSQVKLHCGGAQDAYFTFISNFSVYMSIVTIVMMLVGANILRLFSWRFAALLTPIMVLITSAIFFSAIIYQNQMGACASVGGISMLLIAVIMGSVQNILSKSTKYSLFDPTKEMSYIPLDPELKVKGKAAVDVIGGRLGKSGGAAIQVIMLSFIFAGEQLSSLAGVFGSIVIGMCLLWIAAVCALSIRFEQARKDQNA